MDSSCFDICHRRMVTPTHATIQSNIPEKHSTTFQLYAHTCTYVHLHVLITNTYQTRSFAHNLFFEELLHTKQNLHLMRTTQINLKSLQQDNIGLSQHSAYHLHVSLIPPSCPSHTILLPPSHLTHIHLPPPLCPPHTTLMSPSHIPLVPSYNLHPVSISTWLLLRVRLMKCKSCSCMLPLRHSHTSHLPNHTSLTSSNHTNPTSSKSHYPHFVPITH